MKWLSFLPPILSLFVLVTIIVGVTFLPIPKNQTLILNSNHTKFCKNILIMETKCKEILESICGAEFKKIRPSFLRNPETNKNLELDGYNEKLQLAFEYNGSQHYFYNPHFHKDQKAFETQVKHDKMKLELCKKRNIFLLVIPYHLRINELEPFIRANLPDDFITKGVQTNTDYNKIKNLQTHKLT
tara:strand:- start:735 stop:1292 length:558 start_codon:yes stop_codon:yes gene_type:complete